MESRHLCQANWPKKNRHEQPEGQACAKDDHAAGATRTSVPDFVCTYTTTNACVDVPAGFEGVVLAKGLCLSSKVLQAMFWAESFPLQGPRIMLF